MVRRSSRNPRRAPTIADVAQRAGVSPMTVSRVINAENNVRASTRATVEAAIAELGYAPNAAARILAGAEALRLALLYSNPSAAYLGEFMVGSVEEASRCNAQLVVQKCEIGDHELEIAQGLIRGGIAGIVLPPPLCDSEPLLELLMREDVPTVTVATGRPHATIRSIAIDDRAAARAMADHLIALGHRRIGFVTGNPNQTASAEREAGYRDALAAGGLAVDPDLIAPGLFSYRSGLDAAERLLDLAEQPTAIFASNDDMAAAAIAVAHRRGLDVPRDLTVCGFDDTPLATTIWPELTTIRQPVAQMARAAVRALSEDIRARKPVSGQAPHEGVEFTLVRRQSDAPPRRRARSNADQRQPASTK